MARFYRSQEPKPKRRKRTSTNAKDDVPLERIEHLKFARTLRKLGLFWIHVPNEGRRSAIQGARLKNLGMLKGVSDFIIFDETPRGGYKGIAVEMKRIKRSSTSEEQIAFLQKMADRGYLAVVTKGHQAAEEVLRRVGFLEEVQQDDTEDYNRRINQINPVRDQEKNDAGETRPGTECDPGVNLAMDVRQLQTTTGDGG